MLDFNTLYDHYKANKLTNKRLKEELQQSNQRERTFLKLLKRTEQYGEQAAQIEREYDQLFTADGSSKDPQLNDKISVRVNESVDVPKLDLSVIYL